MKIVIEEQKKKDNLEFIERQFNNSDDILEEIYRVINKCLQVDEIKRPNIEEVLIKLKNIEKKL